MNAPIPPAHREEDVARAVRGAMASGRIIEFYWRGQWMVGRPVLRFGARHKFSLDPSPNDAIYRMWITPLIHDVPFKDVRGLSVIRRNTDTGYDECLRVAPLEHAAEEAA